MASPVILGGERCPAGARSVASRARRFRLPPAPGAGAAALRHLVHRVRKIGDAAFDAEAIRKSVYHEVNVFRQQRVQEDDITLVILKFL